MAPLRSRTARRGRVARDVLMTVAGGIVALTIVFALRDRFTTTTGLRSSATAGAVGDDAVRAEVSREAAETITALASDAPPGSPVNSKQGLGAFPVHNLAGEIVPIVDVGEPAIVMINSRSCGYCKQALRDLEQYAGGRAVPGLRMLTLEGAADGEPMLRAAGVVGAVALGPATSHSQVLLTFRYRGTPTFIAVDAAGFIRGTMPGYPGKEQLAPWFDVMLGDRASP